MRVVWLGIALLVVGIVVVHTSGILNKTQTVVAEGPYNLPPLPYAYDGLEPYIDAETMELHHDKHHRKYVADLNTTLQDYPDLKDKPIGELLAHLDQVPEAIRQKVIDFGGGHYNHSFFWTVMTQDATEPSGDLKELLEKHFGSIMSFKEQFSTAAKGIFGSGWVWLVLDGEELKIMTTANQDSPISEGLVPLLCLDVWEHAYYLQYQNKRPDYITAWWHVVNWEQVAENLRLAGQQG